MLEDERRASWRYVKRERRVPRSCKGDEAAGRGGLDILDGGLHVHTFGDILQMGCNINFIWAGSP